MNKSEYIKKYFFRKVLILATFLTLIINSFITPIYGTTTDYSEVIRSFIYTFDDKNLPVEYIKDLKDIYNSYSY